MPNGAPRLAGFDYVGVFCYSLTICTCTRQNAFDEGSLAEWAIEQLLRTAAANAFDVLAYCVMPDHVHLLVQGRADDASLLRFVKAWKQQTGFEYSRRRGKRLWQVGFYDHIMRSEEDVLKHAKYIVGNPVRAGLTKTVGEYRFAAILMGECEDPTSAWR